MTRRDRFAISTWGDKVYELVLMAVKSNNSQTPLPEQCIYSVIDYVLPEGTRRSAKDSTLAITNPLPEYHYLCKMDTELDQKVSDQASQKSMALDEK